MANYLYISKTGDPYTNMAFDEWFLDHVGINDLILYFYINDPSVIFGKNQNPWRECDLQRMRADGVLPVRRMSGGGAVYHDGGNLNFSFIAGASNFDKQRQTRIVCAAVRSFGIDCAFSGRNDLLLGDGRKFSGSAYCDRGQRHLHHGTLLVSSDLNRLSSYLTVDERKIRAKGVESVRARVCDLRELSPSLTVEELREAVIRCARTFCGAFSDFTADEAFERTYPAYDEKYRSEDWIYGVTPRFEVRFDERLSFGGVECLISLDNGKVSGVKVYTDCNDESFPKRVNEALLGLPYDKNVLSSALSKTGQADLTELARRFEESL